MNSVPVLRKGCAIHCFFAIGSSALALVGCGGGGGSDRATGSGASPAVTSSALTTVKYGQSLGWTLTGSHLDSDLTVSATGCDNVKEDAASSTATSAVYNCTVSATASGQLIATQTSTKTVLTSLPFNVPVPQVTLTVSDGAAVSGTVVLTLAPDKTPITVKNFLNYVNTGFYDQTVIHRVQPGFVIQGGGYAAPLTVTTQTLKTPGAPIALEVAKGLSNTQWTIAMARSADLDSATSQFFINLVDNSAAPTFALSGGYAVFGSVTSGTDNVAAIAAAACTVIPLFLGDNNGCTPIPNVVIVSAVQSQ